MTSSFVGNTQAFQAQVAAPRTGHVRTSSLTSHSNVMSYGLYHARPTPVDNGNPNQEHRCFQCRANLPRLCAEPSKAEVAKQVQQPELQGSQATLPGTDQVNDALALHHLCRIVNPYCLPIRILCF